VVSAQPSLGGSSVSLAWVLSEQWSVLLGGGMEVVRRVIRVSKSLGFGGSLVIVIFP
jgi:hypothetical protein